VDLDESPLPGESPDVYAERLAKEKAMAAAVHSPGVPVVGGDTVVTLDGHLLGKPVDTAHAKHMLRLLSGREHVVVSGWAVVDPDGGVHSGTASAHVLFETLSETQIAEYVQTGEPMDKAGSYGIQGQGGQLVQGYRGDFATIVGLPLDPVLRCLGRLNYVPDTDLFRRYMNILGRVAVAASESGRTAEDIRVIAASKAQLPEHVSALYAYGHRDFGESYVQELRAKTHTVPSDVRWSFIGHLQTNKVRHVLPHVDTIQTVSSLKLARALSSKAAGMNQSVRCLIQVNLAMEDTKSGVSPEGLSDLLRDIRELDNVEVIGLMCLPPRSGLAQARRWFRLLRELRDTVRRDSSDLPELSMGMSGDFDGAIMEGATMVRIGTALFGPRPSR